MTEDDAKTKWCPMVRAGVYGEGAASNSTVSVNRDPRNDDIALCIGSDCMMWRWSFLQKTDSETFPSEGFCGIAGRDGVSAQTPIAAAVIAETGSRRIAGGVYSNPQPGDADFPGG